jgi:hypothetical protein
MPCLIVLESEKAVKKKPQKPFFGFFRTRGLAKYII